MEDFIAQRMSLLSMVKTLHEDTLDFVGHASGNPITPRALLWIILGHFKHHFQILIEKY
jgi:3-hydroxymyristoyl/3-hydroxydecanoyl-(acyl carrier protein) dehydratase